MNSDLDIRPLSPAFLDDYIYYFDHVAFADNPRWAGCYCYFHHAPHQEKKWEERDAAENRAAASELITRGSLRGYLAYMGDEVVGWCNANARERYTTFPPEAIPEGENIGAIVCFNVAPRHRGMGVARALLVAALEGLERDGIASVYAFTRTNTNDAAENCVGPLQMYLDAGFEKIGERPGVALVRKTF